MFHSNRTGLIAGAVWAVLAVGCDKDRDRTTGSVEDAREETGEAPAAVQTPSPTPVNPPARSPEAAHEVEPGEVKAEADLKAADGQEIEGEAKFYDNGKGVRIVAELEDAKPGNHGLHVHEKGDCSNIKGESMGSHFAPAGHQHALPGEAAERHLGDLGNVEVNQDGEGRLEITIDRANLKPNDPMSFLGKALVVHMSEDVGKSKQPSGDSGTPIACGVIEKS